MASNTVSAVVGMCAVPEGIGRVNTLANPDYVDVFTIASREAKDNSPEEWARAALENTPTGRSAPLLWRSIGLRLGPRPSSQHVQGWTITGRAEDWIRMEAASWFMTANAVVKIDDGAVSAALFIRYDRPIAAVIWPPVSVMHRRAMPTLLRQALTARAELDKQLPVAEPLEPSPR
jgi:hypothetical protein